MMRLYDGEISFVDAELGKLLRFLQSQPFSGRTLIVFLSDHGESFDHHYYFDHADRLYESSLRIPLILSYPGLLPQGAVSKETVQTVDLFPTILSLLQFSQATLHEGRSLWPLNKALQRDIRPVYAELSRREGYSTLGDLWAMRLGHWKLIYSPEGRPPELYHLGLDPAERVNLAVQKKDRTVQMSRMLLQWMGGKKSVPQLPVEGLMREKLRSLGYLQ
jgi:arylsulfatase A-like enzyme